MDCLYARELASAVDLHPDKDQPLQIQGGSSLVLLSVVLLHPNANN